MAKHDEQVKQLMAQVEIKKSALGARPKAVLTTNGLLKLSDKEHVNLNTLNDIEEVIKAYANVLSNFEAMIASASALGVTDYQYKFSGYTLEEWFSDFQFRVYQINWSKKDKELSNLTKKLESLVSEDLKTENELASIMDALK